MVAARQAVRPGRSRASDDALTPAPGTGTFTSAAYDGQAA
jgi:hypothetical protein